MEPPEVRYAWNGSVALAYQVFGEGPVDLVYLQGYTSHVDQNWGSPYLAQFLRGLGDLARVIHTDRRGWGCSDRFSPGDVAPLEVQVDDLAAVMDAAGSRRAVIFASHDTVPTAVLFAASLPERAAGLVLCDPLAAFYDTVEARQEFAELNARVRREWGTPAWDLGASWDQREFANWFVPWCRAAVAPGALAAESDAFGSVDVRGALSSIHVPTLVVGHGGATHHEDARDVAEGVADARLLEPAGESSVGPFHWYGRAPEILHGVGELIQGIDEEQRSFDRTLATVMFTDVVGSTDIATTMGDHRWRGLLGQHHATIRGLLARYRGREAGTAGDGFFATFDGPARAVRCAMAIASAIRVLGLEVRVGIHTGEVETIDGEVGGIAVHVGARVAAIAGASEVLVSSTVKDLTLGSGLQFEDAGEHDLKGVPDRWHLYRVTS
jgi:class 3 adenylate cyclase/pimeloyl-ACP methyl ester carboxylesterase